MTLSGIALFTSVAVWGPHVATIALFSLFFITACTIIFANAAAGALTPISENIGTASALFGSVQILVPALASALVSVLPLDLSILLALVYFGIGVSILYLISQIASSKSLD